jgi:hypothetical protein
MSKQKKSQKTKITQFFTPVRPEHLPKTPVLVKASNVFKKSPQKTSSSTDSLVSIESFPGVCGSPSKILKRFETVLPRTPKKNLTKVPIEFKAIEGSRDSPIKIADQDVSTIKSVNKRQPIKSSENSQSIIKIKSPIKIELDKDELLEISPKQFTPKKEAIDSIEIETLEIHKKKEFIPMVTPIKWSKLEAAEMMKDTPEKLEPKRDLDEFSDLDFSDSELLKSTKIIPKYTKSDSSDDELLKSSRCKKLVKSVHENDLNEISMLLKKANKFKEKTAQFSNYAYSENVIPEESTDFLVKKEEYEKEIVNEQEERVDFFSTLKKTSYISADYLKDFRLLLLGLNLKATNEFFLYIFDKYNSGDLEHADFNLGVSKQQKVQRMGEFGLKIVPKLEFTLADLSTVYESLELLGLNQRNYSLKDYIKTNAREERSFQETKRAFEIRNCLDLLSTYIKK